MENKNFVMAPLWSRFLAFVVDIILLTIIELLIINAIYSVSPQADPKYVQLFFFWLLATYFVSFWVSKGATVGKLLFKIKVVDAHTGEYPTVFQGLWRAFSYLFSLATFGVGFLWGFFDKNRRMWQDITADTVVVKESASGSDISTFLIEENNKIQKYLVTTVGLIFVFFAPLQNFHLSSNGMANTLPKGTHLFVNRYAYGLPFPSFTPAFSLPSKQSSLIAYARPKRGDIVVFRYPKNTSLFYLSRCAALPNDQVFVKNKDFYLHPHEGNDFVKANYPESNVVEYDGKLWVKNSYLLGHKGIRFDGKIVDNGQYPSAIFNLPAETIPEGQYFILGDNRDHSYDSRFYGTVPYGFITGKFAFAYWKTDL